MASCLAMVSYPAFSVAMLTRSFPASFPFLIFLGAASTSHAIIGDTSSWYVCIFTAWSMSYNSEYNYSIRAMILSCSCIYLPCLSRSVIIRCLPRLCVLLTFSELMPQLFLVFHLSCASGYLPSLSFLWSYISPQNSQLLFIILCGH